MSSRVQLGWLVPRSSWELLEQRILDKKRFRDPYTGIEAEQIADLWLALEESDTTPRAGHTGTPLHTNEKNVSDTPLDEKEKTKVNVRMHPDTKEQLSIYASRYDVHEGVLLAYIIREYYETDGWGYSIEAIGAARDADVEQDIPHSESGKKEWICDRIEPDPNGTIHGDDIRDLIREVGAESRINHYLPAVVDQLDYVHHPQVYGLYIPREQMADHGLISNDPALYRKPYEALDRSEKIEGIRAVLSTRGVAMPVNRIHAEVFDGNGSTQHIRDLVHTVAEASDATYQPTAGGTKVLRVTSDEYPPEPGSEPATTEPESESSKPADEPVDESAETEIESDEKRDELEDEAAVEMGALMNATQARTDGGDDI